jgi:hypothetical protein
MSELTTTARGRSLGSRVEPWLRHARKFGDPRSVYETAEQELPARELGYLAARLRSTQPVKENDHYIVNRDARNEKRVPWPKFQLTTDERDRLAGRLLAEGVEHRTIAAYLGSTSAWVKRFAAEVHSASEASRLLAEHGPVDLLDSSTPTELSNAWTAILSGQSGLSKDSCSTSTNTGGSSTNPVLGSRIGRLVVLSFGRNSRRQKTAQVRCDCGTVKEIVASSLGKARSCGCLRRERMAAMRRGKG